MSGEVLYEIKGPKTIYEMSWPEVEEALKNTDIVLIPVGSTEQHGTHLPLGSDTIQGWDMVRMIIKQMADEGITVCSAPCIPFGVSQAHMKFPGSITLTSDTLMRVMKDVVRSLHFHGFRKFMLLISHGGNLQTLRLVAQDLGLMLPDSIFVVPDWIPVQSAHYPEVLQSPRATDEHHSGEGETARMIYSTPNLVSPNRGEPYYVPEELNPYAKKPYTGSVSVVIGGQGMKEMTAFGVMGDPARATAEAGAKLYKIITDWLCQIIRAELL